MAHHEYDDVGEDRGDKKFSAQEKKRRKAGYEGQGTRFQNKLKVTRHYLKKGKS